MPRITRIQIAKSDIVALFERRGQKVYKSEGIAEILEQNRLNWRLTINQSLSGFIEFLLKRTSLREVVLTSVGGSVTRYTWGEANVYEVALSLNQEAYLSHGTAVYLHGLTDQIPKRIYVNHEQGPKPGGKVTLSQAGIDAAFKKPARVTHAVFQLGELQIVSINGKHTGRLEVGTLKDPDGPALDVTKLERTLIDIAVRPVYAGGVIQVLEAYKAARSRVSVNVLAATLKRLGYIYPYQQCIGFYMARAGYESARVEYMHSMPMNFDFYLANEMGETEYDSNWRLFHPRGM